MKIDLIEGETTVTKEGAYVMRSKPVTTARKAPDEQQIRDTFQTPNYAVDLIIPFIPKNITSIWEPAYGKGKISGKMKLAGYTVFESDLKSEDPNKVRNFISEYWLDIPEECAIITNPPFSIKDLFIERCFEYNRPFALLINADYSQWQIDLIKMGCEKIIPTSRIAYITPNIVRRVNEAENKEYITIEEIPMEYLYKYSNAQFHSMWLTYGFGLGRTETFVDLSVEQRRYNI